MTRSDVAVGLGAFAAVVAVAVGGAALAPTLVQQGPPPSDASVPSAFAAGSTSVNASVAAGEVTVDASSSGDVVVLDVAHGNDQSTEKVQTLERLLVENGYAVRYHGNVGTSGSSTGGYGSSDREGPDLNESLRGADAYVIVNPSTPYDAEEAASVESFADAGGRVLVMSDPESVGLVEMLSRALGGGGGGPPDALAPLSSRFGLGVDSGYLYNMAEYDGNYQTVYASGNAGSLSEGVDRVTVRRAAPVVTGPDATVAIATSAETELSDSGAADRYAVAARNGNVAIVGDTSVLDPSRLRHADNEAFVGNLVEFLVGGTVRSGAFASPESPSASA